MEIASNSLLKLGMKNNVPPVALLFSSATTLVVSTLLLHSFDPTQTIQSPQKKLFCFEETDTKEETHEQKTRGKLIDINGEAIPNAVVFQMRDNRRTQKNETLTLEIQTSKMPKMLPIAISQRLVIRNDLKEQMYFSNNRNDESPNLVIGKVHTFQFDKIGPARIFCNSHTDKDLVVFVCPTKIFSVTDSKGNFEIAISEENFSVKFWHPKLGYLPLGTKERGVKIVSPSSKQITIKAKSKVVNR